MSEEYISNVDIVFIASAFAVICAGIAAAFYYPSKKKIEKCIVNSNECLLYKMLNLFGQAWGLAAIVSMFAAMIALLFVAFGEPTGGKPTSYEHRNYPSYIEMTPMSRL